MRYYYATESYTERTSLGSYSGSTILAFASHADRASALVTRPGVAPVTTRELGAARVAAFWRDATGPNIWGTYWGPYAQ